MNLQEIQKLERAERKEAIEINRRTGNYYVRPFKDNVEVTLKPHNCYGCSWEFDLNRKVYRLKYKHKSCFASHNTDQS